MTARVSPLEGGPMGTPLNVIVENTGNRPAISVRLSVNTEELKNALHADVEDTDRKSLKRLFSDAGTIPVLGNGKFTSAAFGFLSGDAKSTWNGDLMLNITISYRDLDRRAFTHTISLFVRGGEGFTGDFWGTPNE